MTAYLNHITLITGHTRRSPRAEVEDAALDVVQDILAAGTAATGAPVPLPSSTPGTQVTVIESAGVLLATVSIEYHPVVTLGVARRSRNAGRLWGDLLDAARETYPTLTDPGMPAVPWLAAITWPALTATDARWLADFERLLAWAWIEGRK